jgi:hypothetical protein
VRHLVEGITEIAGSMAALGQPQRAARLFGGAEVVRLSQGNRPLHPLACEDYARDVAAVRAQLDDEAVAVAWDEGRAMSLAHVIAVALEAGADPQ